MLKKLTIVMVATGLIAFAVVAEETAQEAPPPKPRPRKKTAKTKSGKAKARRARSRGGAKPARAPGE